MSICMDGKLKTTLPDLFAELRRLETRVAQAVCSVHGTITADEIHRLSVLRRRLGLTWDAINLRWLDLQD